VVARDFPVARELTPDEVDHFVNNFDHHDPRFGQDPFPVYERMVRECPIQFSPNYGGFWVITGYEEAHWAWQNYEFLATQPSVSVPAGLGNTRPMLPLEVDPPIHSKYRSLLAPVFAPARIEALEPEIRALCDSLIDDFIDRGECEFIAEFAEPLPTRIFATMLGIPLDEAETFKRWKNAILHGVADDPTGIARADAGKNARERLAEILEERKRQRGDDIISVLIDSEVDQERLDDESLLDIAFLLFLAGLDTVQGALGFQYAYLATHPQQRDRLVSKPSLIKSATEELLRWDGVVIAGRNVTRDFEYKGHQFKRGQQVIMVNRPADRDPREFDAPDSVKFDRGPLRSIAFAVGPHRCVGSHLARLEIKVVHEQMHERIPTYRLKQGTTVRSHGGNVAGLDELFLAWDH
jgi:cytochrome P450